MLTSEKKERNSGFKEDLVISWLSRVILMDSDLSLAPLLASLMSIDSKSSFRRYLSNSLPKPSDNYEIK